MGSEWIEAQLGDICTFQEGYVNPSQEKSEYFDGEIKWIRAVDLNNGFVHNTSRTLTRIGFDSAGKSASFFEPNTIVISKSGTIGRLGIITDFMCGNRATINIKPIKEVSTRFVFYLLRSHQRDFDSLAVGSVQKNLYVSALETLEVMLPDLETQSHIAATLSSLDDKIELNNRIIANLEAQAQAIYTEIFQDDDSAIELGEVCATTSGGTPSRTHPEYFGGNIPWVKSKELNSSYLLSTEETVTNEAIAASSAKILPLHSVLIAMYGATVGEYCVIITEMACNQAICAIIPNTVYTYEYLFQVAKNNRDNL